MAHPWRLVLAVASALALAACAPAQPGSAQDRALLVAAASDLRFAFGELLPHFEAVSGHRVEVTYGSSGLIYQQVVNGAPIDVFFSADMDLPRRLAEQGLTDGPVVPYATGHLAVWTNKPTFAPWVQRLEAPLLPAGATIAIANPDLAPYGRAAMAALAAGCLPGAESAKLATAENVSQAAQMAQSGAADIGVIGLALAQSPNMQGGWFTLVPQACHPPLRQGAVALRTPRAAAARTLLQYVAGSSGQAVLQRYGFEPPQGP